MVEGGAAEASENDLIDALMFAHEAAQPIIELIEKLRAAVGKPKRVVRAEEAPRRRSPRRSPRSSTSRSSSASRHQGQEGALRRLQGRSRTTHGRGAHGGARRREVRRAREAHQGRVRGAQVRTSCASTCSTRSKRIDGRDMHDDPPDRVRGRASCRACTARRCSSAARRRRSSRRRSAPRATSRRSTRSPASAGSASCSTTTSRPSRRARPSRCAAPAVARSATAPSPSARSSRMMPEQEKFPYTIRIVCETLESNGSSLDGGGLRRLALAHGRRRPDQGARRRHRDGPHHGGQAHTPS